MDVEDVLRVLKNGAEKPKDDLNDYTKGKRDGQVQAYSHAWTLVKNLSISSASQQRELLTRFLKEYNQGKLTVSDDIDIDLFLNDNKSTQQMEGVMSPKDYMFSHPVGQNVCYWMAVEFSGDEPRMENLRLVMKEYAEYYHEAKLKEKSNEK